MTDAQVIQAIDDNIRANGIQAITGGVSNMVLNAMFRTLRAKMRVIMFGETYTVAEETEIHWAQDLYNKGTLSVGGLPEANYGFGLPVSRVGIVRVDGVLINEGMIINNGIIIN